jgi:hypothetical protein
MSHNPTIDLTVEAIGAVTSNKMDLTMDSDGLSEDSENDEENEGDEEDDEETLSEIDN